MEIRSELDAILRDIPENTHVYNSEESLKNAFPRKKKKRPIWLIAAIILVLAGFGKKIREEREENPLLPPSGQIQQITVSGNTPSRSDTVFLEKQSDGSYHVVTDVIRSDKILYYDRDADSYYDETTDCWAWYNTDVEPAVWQFWVEGISSDYGDYGWMEHDPSGWFIEKSEGEWIPVPDQYDTTSLWWIG